MTVWETGTLVPTENKHHWLGKGSKSCSSHIDPGTHFLPHSVQNIDYLSLLGLVSTAVQSNTTNAQLNEQWSYAMHYKQWCGLTLSVPCHWRPLFAGETGFFNPILKVKIMHKQWVKGCHCIYFHLVHIHRILFMVRWQWNCSILCSFVRNKEQMTATHKQASSWRNISDTDRKHGPQLDAVMANFRREKS